MEQIGKYVFYAGIFLAIIGVILWLVGDKLNWLGNLPGDIKIEKENVKVYIPLTTMILVSVLLSVILWLVKKIF